MKSSQTYQHVVVFVLFSFLFVGVVNLNVICLLYSRIDTIACLLFVEMHYYIFCACRNDRFYTHII